LLDKAFGRSRRHRTRGAGNIPTRRVRLLVAAPASPERRRVTLPAAWDWSLGVKPARVKPARLIAGR